MSNSTKTKQPPVVDKTPAVQEITTPEISAPEVTLPPEDLLNDTIKKIKEEKEEPAKKPAPAKKQAGITIFTAVDKALTLTIMANGNEYRPSFTPDKSALRWLVDDADAEAFSCHYHVKCGKILKEE